MNEEPSPPEPVARFRDLVVDQLRIEDFRLYGGDSDDYFLSLIACGSDCRVESVSRAEIEPYILQNESWWGTWAREGFDPCCCITLPCHPDAIAYLLLSRRPQDDEKRRCLLQAARQFAFHAYSEQVLLNQRERKVLELLGGLNSGLAHDILSGLTSVETYFQLLDNGGEKARKLAPIARGNLETTLERVRHARLYDPRGVLVTSGCDFLSMCRESVRRCLDSTHAKAMTLHFQPDPFPDVRGNSFLLQRLLDNLFKNSQQSGSRNLKVSANSTNDQLIIIIDDDGKGIQAQQLPYLFLKGFSTRKGSGLGLSIVKLIVHLHGGRIHVLPANGDGARFELQFSQQD